MWPVSLVKHVAANTDTHLKKTINQSYKQTKKCIGFYYIY